MASTTAQDGAASKPNIVFFLVDNIGWGDFSVYGGVTPTPRIDRLASEGIRFNNYNVECQCTPSRSAIMTGRHPVRSGTYCVPAPGQGLSGLAPWEYTIAELLSDAGYATAMKIYKVVLRYSEGIDKPIVALQFPMFYDLSSDPHEGWNLFSKKMDSGWMAAPLFQNIMKYEMSLKEYQNIKLGEEFKGYPQPESKVA